MIFVKKSTFFSYLFLEQKKARKNHFFMFWIERNAFYTTKVKFFKNLKKPTFSKGVSPRFLSKNRPFSYIFVLSKKSHKEKFFYTLDSKECFLHLKSEVLGKSKESTFSKGLVHGFWQKIDLFVICFFF